MSILPNIIPEQAKRYGDKEAMNYVNEHGEVLQALSYRQLNDQVDAAACGFETLGLEPGDVVMVLSPNRPEMLITDFACYTNRAVPVSIYSTASAEQLDYVLHDCKPRFVIAGTVEHLDLLRPLTEKCPWVEHLLLYDGHSEHAMPWADLIALGLSASDACRAEVEKRRRSVRPEDTATLVYTSGTTGEPKGADLPHSCFNAVIKIHRERLTMLSDNDRSLCFLPLCHIFEKGWSYVCIALGMHIAINQNPREIAGAVRNVRPTCMCSVPRFWEKVYSAVIEKIAEMPMVKRKMVMYAIRIGRKRNLDYVRLGKEAPGWLEAMYRKFDKTVFEPMKRAIGIENGNLFPTAGAPISPHIVRFFRSIGVPMMVGYGLSETTATVTCFPTIDYVIGSVGTVMPEVMVRIAPQAGEPETAEDRKGSGEIQVKGPTVMRGYFNKPKDTAEAFTEDGWFRTGDAGYFDREGALVLTERIKDLFKTSNGKYIAPQAIESRLGEDKYIEQVAVVGESRKYVTALIIPAFGVLKEYARRHKIAFKNLEDLIQNSQIIKLIADHIERLQKGLPSFEQIKKFTLLPKAFTIESGELTNTLKIRRPVINEHYAKEIEAMYA